MLPNVWHKIQRCTGGAMVLLALAVPATAQQPAIQQPAIQQPVLQPPVAADQRLDRLEKQNEEFRKQVETLIKKNQALQAKTNSWQRSLRAPPARCAVSRA